MITDAYSETLAIAPNERKKLDVIITALSHMVKQELMVFLENFKSEIIQHVKHHEGITVYCGSYFIYIYSNGYSQEL